MSRRRFALGVGIFASAVLLTIGTVVLLLTDASPISEGSRESMAGEILALLSSLAFAAIGSLVALRRPENPVGWFVAVGGLAFQIENFGSAYATSALELHPGSLPGGVAAALIADTFWVPSITLSIVAVFLLFPDGRPISPRWRPVLAAAFVAAAASVPTTLFGPGPLYYAESVDNPLGISSAAGAIDVVQPASLAVIGIAMLLSLVTLVMRVRRARGIERQQLKWFVFASGVLLLGAVPMGIFLDDWAGASLITELAAVGVIASLAIAILRYRLYDIDVIINRTIVYVTLTGILAAAYLGLVVVLQSATSSFTSGSDLAVAASTLTVAALFRPVRTRVQKFIDLRFYRARYDARVIATRFAESLRDEVSLDSLSRDLLGTVRTTVAPAHASLWIAEEKGGAWHARSAGPQEDPRSIPKGVLRTQPVRNVSGTPGA